MSDVAGGRSRVAATSKLLLGVELRDPAWFRPVRKPIPVGTPARSDLQIPQPDAQRLLRAVVRRVADLPVGSSPDVVWTDDSSELLVHTDSISIACQNGLVTIGLSVACDQVSGKTTVAVPFAVGTPKVPAGLVMHTFDRLAGPALITETWSGALTAFAWESLIELTRSVCAQVGKDSEGRPLVPGAIAAASRVLLVRPMGRHDVSLRASR